MISLPQGAQSIYCPLPAKVTDVQEMTELEKFFRFEMEEALPVCLHLREHPSGGRAIRVQHFLALFA